MESVGGFFVQLQRLSLVTSLSERKDIQSVQEHQVICIVLVDYFYYLMWVSSFRLFKFNKERYPTEIKVYNNIVFVYINALPTFNPQ